MLKVHKQPNCIPAYPLPIQLHNPPDNPRMLTQRLKQYQVIPDHNVLLPDIKRIVTVEQRVFLVGYYLAYVPPDDVV